MTARADGGFTLVEALVSLFIFSIVAAGGVAMLAQSVSAQRDIGAAHESLRSLQTTRAFLASDLSQLSLREPRLDDGRHAPAFGGGGASLTLVRTVTAADLDSTNGLVRVAYIVDGDRLVRRLYRDVDGGGAPQERVLLEGVAGARLGFFDGAVWFDRWDAPGAAPPKAVSLDVTVPRYGAVRMAFFVGMGS